MALTIADRVRETTTTTGTGTITLNGAVGNFETFTSNLSDGDTTYYAIVDANNSDFEVGLGTFASSGTTLARTTVIASSNSNSAVSLSSGSKDVFITLPASKMIFQDASGNVTIPGDLTVSGDDITMGTNTSGNLLIADGTNFNSIAVGSLSEISTVASDDVFIAVDTSGGGLKKISRSAIVSGLASSSAISNVVEDTTPQLGGNLDTNSHSILLDDAHFIGDENGNEQIIFQTTSSAVNQFDVTNAATGNAPELSATGGDTNISLKITPKGSGQVLLDGNVGVESGLIDLKNSGSRSQIKFYCESSNAHAQALQAAPHSESASNTLTLPSTGGDADLVSVSSTATLTNKTLSSPTINTPVITTIKNTSLVIGRDDDNLIKFSTDNQIIFEVSGGDNVIFKASGEIEATSLDISGDVDIDGTLEADAVTVNGTALATVIAGTTVSNATLAATATVTDSTANTNFPVVFHDESNALLDDTGALRYNPSTGTLLVPNLSVAGTTTTVDTVTINAQNAIVFEGATADDHETTLTIVDPTADRTINLPNQSGTIPVLAVASNTAITSTPAELNILDGVTSTATELNILDGVTATTAELNYSDTGASVGTVVASKVVTADANKDVASFRNITLTGELDAGSLDVSGDADIDGTLEADAITVNGTALATVIADEATGKRTAHLIKDVPIPVGSTVEIMQGNKIVLNADDRVKVDASVTDKVSVTMSYMEIT
jgi:cytoskeletal protein CcmA (bactofilin family)